MKKTLATTLALALSVCTIAGNVSRTRAAEYAAGIFGTQVSSLQQKKAPRASVNVPASAEEMYWIFNNPGGGFAIISALDNTMPILGYSSEGSMDTDNLPPAAFAWLTALEQELRDIRDADPPATEEITRQWRAPRLTPGDNGIVRETPRWGQGSPYNAMCPKVNGAYCMTGCVATAACEVMRYFNWPESRSVTIPAYTSTWHDVSIKMESRGPATYDWANMPMSGGNSAVALLMADVGAALKSSYGTSSTAAVSSDVVSVLPHYFSYSKAASFKNRNSYTEANWEYLLTKQIDDNGPVFFRATAANPDAAHAFVLDGHDAAGYFHFNFGWTGSSNGWFLVTALGPASGYTFTAEQSAAFDLVPDKGEPPVVKSGLSFSLGFGMRTDAEISVGVPFSMTIAPVTNLSSYYNGKLRIVLKDIDDNIRQENVNQEEIPFICWEGVSSSPGSIACRLDVEPRLGDKFVVQSLAGDRWSDIGFNSTKTIGEFPLFPMYIITDLAGHVVKNGNKLYSSAKWTSNRVVLTYADGTEETIIQE